MSEACGCGSGCGCAPQEPLSAAASESPAPHAEVIASSEQEWPIVSVNEVPITPQAMALEVQYHPAGSREEAVYSAARALVIRELLQQRIAALGLSLQIGPGENEEEAATRLLLEREVPVPVCDEATCQGYYERNRVRFHSAPLLAVRHILLECAPDDDEARSLALTQAEALQQKLSQFPEQFAELAKAHSACPSRAQGGSLGQISKGQTVSELERQLFALPTGLADAPLESRYGWHVISVDQRAEGQPLPYEAVAPSIRNLLQQGVWQKAVVQYLQTLIGAADIRGIQLQGADSPLVQ
ncbi:peptidylprolyl isomerase [Pseudomonas sp. RC10]|uniref:peptidylprolyl isomerase n=1 Tax=Pseudomonas bambusae TaxID=3139142 RepID=UPI00313948F8